MSRLLARTTPLRSPPVLVLSFPRSGSSWVGEILGNAADALYLREPVTQGHLASGASRGVFWVDPQAPPAHYRRLADAAFSGTPAFPRNVVRRPEQWKRSARAGRRVVVKEVNPLASAWLLDTYRPRVIFLVRHPAAVAASYWDLGWRAMEQHLGNLPDAVLDGPLQRWRDAIRQGDGFWLSHGLFQGCAIHLAQQALEGYPEHRVVRYEDLCADPLGHFRALFAYAGLAWSADTEALVASRSEARSSGSKHAFATARDSSTMAQAWRTKVANFDLAELRRGYGLFGLPWYGSDAEW